MRFKVLRALEQQPDLSQRQLADASLEQIMFGVDVTHVQPLKEQRLQVTFSDDVTAVREMDRVLKHDYEVHRIMRRSRSAAARQRDHPQCIV
jgi:hypothetical protein